MKKRVLTILTLSLLLGACSSQPEKGAGGGSETSNAPATPKSASTPSQDSGALIRAVVDGDRAKVRELINAGADVNQTIGSGNHKITPLLAAVALGRRELVELLVRKGAKNDIEYQGYSALDIAVATGEDASEQAIMSTERKAGAK